MIGESFMTRLRASRFFNVLRSSVERRIVWVREDRRTLQGELSEDFAWVAIIGRELYEHSSVRVPVRAWWDCRKVAQLEMGGSTRGLAFVGPLADDHRQIDYFHIHESVETRHFRAVFWIPESFLLWRSTSTDRITEVIREGFGYFLSPAGASQVKGGLVCSPELFALAVGGVFRDSPETLDSQTVPPRLRAGLSALRLADWFGFLSPGLDEGVRRHGRPVTIGLLGIFVAYLSLVSVSLEVGQRVREWQLARLDADVATLIVKQRNVDQLETEHRGLARVINAPVWSYRVWELAAVVWRSGGSVINLSLADDKVTLRGVAPSATEILRAIAALPQFSGARFDAPVRRSEDPRSVQEEFTIVARIKLSGAP